MGFKLIILNVEHDCLIFLHEIYNFNIYRGSIASPSNNDF